MNEPTSCETCGGLGFYEVDRADHRGEHFTAEVTCECSAVVDDDERDEPDGDGDGAQEAPL